MFLSNRAANFVSLSILSIAAVVLPNPLKSQLVTIPYSVTCASCRIITEPVVTLGSPTDSVLLHAGSYLARDSRGNYYATAHGGMGLVIFDSTGRYLRAFGRQGAGPGEISNRIMGFSILADTLYVFLSRQRVVVFSPSLAHVRTVDFLPVVPNSSPRVVGSRGNFVAYGNVRSDTAASKFKYHLVAADGKRTPSLGAHTAPTGQPSPSAVQGATVAGLDYLLTPADEQIWTSDGDYRITRWDMATGSGITMQVMDVPWLRNRPPPPSIETVRAQMSTALEATLAGRPQPPPSYPPRPFVSLARIDQQQRAWFWSYVHFNNSARPAGPLSSCQGTSFERSTPGWRSCALLEIVDTRNRRLLVSQLMETSGYFIPNTDLMATSIQDQNGVTSLKVFRVRLVGAP